MKADAYGLGAATVATALNKAGCSRFYVAWPSEGAALRRALGVTPEIMVFHGATADTMDIFQMYQLVPVLNHLEQIDLWVSGNISPRPAAVHVDVGMNRLGLAEEHLAAAAKMLPKPSRILGHLSCGDEVSPLNAEQLAIFERAAKFWPGTPVAFRQQAALIWARRIISKKSAPASGSMAAGPSRPRDHTRTRWSQSRRLCFRCAISKRVPLSGMAHRGRRMLTPRWLR